MRARALLLAMLTLPLAGAKTPWPLDGPADGEPSLVLTVTAAGAAPPGTGAAERAFALAPGIFESALLPAWVEARDAFTERGVPGTVERVELVYGRPGQGPDAAAPRVAVRLFGTDVEPYEAGPPEAPGLPEGAESLILLVSFRAPYRGVLAELFTRRLENLSDEIRTVSETARGALSRHEGPLAQRHLLFAEGAFLDRNVVGVRVVSEAADRSETAELRAYHRAGEREPLFEVGVSASDPPERAEAPLPGATVVAGAALAAALLRARRRVASDRAGRRSRCGDS